MDRLEAMQVLVHIVDGGSLSAAGRKLGMPLATVSRKLSELEAHIKTRLITRSTRQLTLTEAGAAYVATCRRVLEEVDQAERLAAGEYSAPTGDLVITAPIVFGRLHVLPVITDFLGAYPQINVRLVLGDRWMNLLEDHLDLAVRIGPLSDSSLVATKIAETRRVVCGSPSYFASRGTPRHPRELAAHACITFEGLMSPTQWVFGSGKTALPVPIRSRLIVTTGEAAIDAAVADLGITRVIAYQIAEQRRRGALVCVLDEFETTVLPIHLVYAGQGRLPLKLRAFIDFAAPRLKARLAG